MAPNNRILVANPIRQFDRQKFRSDGDCRERAVDGIVANFPKQPTQPVSYIELSTKPLSHVTESSSRQCYIINEKYFFESVN